MIKYEIEGGSLPVVICYPQEGETLCTQSGAMSWMSPNIKMDTNSGAESTDGINIFLKTIDGETTEIKCKLSDPVSSIIEQYKKSNHIENKVQILLTFKGKSLNPNEKVEKYDIQSDEVLHVIVRLPGGR